MDLLNAEPIYHSPAIRAVYARVRQFAHLTADATDLLLGAVDLLDDTHAGIPVQDEGRLLTLLTYQQALDEADSRVTLVRNLTVLGAQDALTTAELYVTERRRGVHPLPQPLPLSPAQNAVLRSVAQGEVTVTDDKPLVRRDNTRVSISTIRSLESRGLVTREPCPLWLADERVHLTTDGCRGLAATFGRPRPSVSTTTRPASRPTTAHAATR
ncbi:hypothetical protein DVK44_27180 [Streptomyces paludis]|uniref:Uncharacterized protein n=1 Tax=Streptomyces paludis TaxID=2282738 RepID=A0A345I1V6_9ACTN|nr:hypothetical protein DVK44_27180 [Streptomyces paludis]